MRGLHNDGRIGTADKEPNQIGITVRFANILLDSFCLLFGPF